MWLCYRGGCTTGVAPLQRWLYHIGGCISEVVVVETLSRSVVCGVVGRHTTNADVAVTLCLLTQNV